MEIRLLRVKKSYIIAWFILCTNVIYSADHRVKRFRSAHSAKEVAAPRAACALRGYQTARPVDFPAKQSERKSRTESPSGVSPSANAGEGKSFAESSVYRHSRSPSMSSYPSPYAIPAASGSLPRLPLASKIRPSKDGALSQLKPSPHSSHMSHRSQISHPSKNSMFDMSSPDAAPDDSAPDAAPYGDLPGSLHESVASTPATSARYSVPRMSGQVSLPPSRSQRLFPDSATPSTDEFGSTVETFDETAFDTYKANRNRIMEDQREELKKIEDMGKDLLRHTEDFPPQPTLKNIFLVKLLLARVKKRVNDFMLKITDKPLPVDHRYDEFIEFIVLCKARRSVISYADLARLQGDAQALLNEYRDIFANYKKNYIPHLLARDEKRIAAFLPINKGSRSNSTFQG